MNNSRAGCFVVLSSMLAGCGACPINRGIDTVENVTQATLATIEDAINDLSTASADWQAILVETRDKLVEDGQSTVRNEITNLISRTTGMAGSEFRCNVDFARERVRESLIRIREELLGHSPQPLDPVFCTVVPAAIDLGLEPSRRSLLEIFGYNFDARPVQVLLENTSNRVDVTNSLASPTHYHLTINLGANGVPLSQQSQKLLLRWNNTDQQSISIIQPPIPTCARETVNVDNKVVTYMPPKVGGGDADFNGHGPKVSVSVSISANATKLTAEVRMKAEEWENGARKSDYTTAEGTRNFDLYQVGTGRLIEGIETDTADSLSYVDTDHTNDQFQAGGLVSRYVVVGDMDRPDAGVSSQVTVSFARIRLRVRETQNCTP